MGTLESTDGKCTYTTGGAVSAFATSKNGQAIRPMFYFNYETIKEENESKLSSEGEIRTDRSNTDESFCLDLNQYIDFCDDMPAAQDEENGRLRANSNIVMTKENTLLDESAQAAVAKVPTNQTEAQPVQGSTENSNVANEQKADGPRRESLQTAPSFIESLRGQLSGDLDMAAKTTQNLAGNEVQVERKQQVLMNDD